MTLTLHSMSKIRVNIVGGIGNQIFQYAFARAISIKFNKKIIFDYSWFLIKKNYKSEFILKKILKKNTLKQFQFTKHINFLFKIFTKLRLINYIKEDTLAYNIIENLNSTYTLVSGYWQNEKYFKDYRKVILSDIQLPDVNYLSKYIKPGFNHVGIHFRRGDYLSKINLSIHGMCDYLYYQEAIKYINQKSKKNFYFIFTNDKLWAKKNIKKILNTDQFKIIYAKNDIDEFSFFVKCNHFICANSTFSWWAAWLSVENNKIVIIPKKWFADDKLNNQIDIGAEDWIKL